LAEKGRLEAEAAEIERIRLEEKLAVETERIRVK